MWDASSAFPHSGINIPSLHLSFFSEPIHMPMQLSITTLRSVARKVISFLCTHGKGDLRCRACGINKQQARHHVRGHLQKMHGRDSCMIWDKAQRQGVASRTGQNIIPARADWPKHVSRCPHCREEAAGGVGSRHPALPGNLLADEDCWESRFSSAFSGYHHYIYTEFAATMVLGASEKKNLSLTGTLSSNLK